METLYRRQVKDINVNKNWANQFGELYLAETLSDVVLQVENEQLFAHQLILAMHSEYFKQEFATKSSNNYSISAPIIPFKEMLRYIYTGTLALSQMKPNEICDILILAYEFKVQKLVQSILVNIKKVRDPRNIFTALKILKYYKWYDLLEEYLTIADIMADSLIGSVDFKHLDSDVLCDLLKRDTFAVTEEKLLFGIHAWYKENPDGDIDMILSFIRFSLMDQGQLTNIFEKYKFLNDKQLLRIVSSAKSHIHKFIQQSSNKSFKHNAHVIYNGDQPADEKLVRCKAMWNTIGNFNGIIIKLPEISIINNITFCLQFDNYSYIIEGSVNLSNWNRIIDYSNFRCKRKQNLYFNRQQVQYIRVIGTKSSFGINIFKMTDFDCSYIYEIPRHIDGFVVATKNVGYEAVVVEGSSQDMLWANDNCTEHDISVGRILIQFQQPYMISSLRLLLNTNGIYQFFIKTSCNLRNWDLAADCRNEFLTSWQTFQFEARPALYIAICGVRSTLVKKRFEQNTNVFSCQYFECPTKYSRVDCASGDELEAIAGIMELMGVD